MRIQDRELVVLYWKLQKKVHTDPKVRILLREIIGYLNRRHIGPKVLNEVGLGMVSDGQI